MKQKEKKSSRKFKEEARNDVKSEEMEENKEKWDINE